MTTRDRGHLILAITGLGLVFVPAEPQQQSAAVPAPVARFHHVHYTVPDPAAAMSAVVQATEGVRVIVQGLGVGVRSGREFVLFDRQTAVPAPAGPSALAAYADVVTRLQAAGFSVDPPSAGQLRAVHALAGLAMDHLAFAVDDLAGEATRLERSGARVVTKREGAVLFAADGVAPIELVTDTEREERFWCPMHPDMRSAEPGRCSLCAMELVPIPPPRIGEYGLDVAVQRDRRTGTVRTLVMTIREPDTNLVVQKLQVVHERPLHLFIVSRDLRFFDHVHPERRADGRYALHRTLPEGEYMVIADFLPDGGTSQMVQRAVISGRPRDERPVPTAEDQPRSVSADGITVRLDAAPLAAGKTASLTFHVTDEKTGAPVTDLQPYLGAPAHMLIVRDDLTDAIHAHPEEVATGGPSVSFHPLIPAPGAYRLWIQFQRGGRVITVPFWLRAER